MTLQGKGPMPLVDINAALAESAVTWADLRWIRELWRGPIVDRGAVRTLEFFAEPIETPGLLEKLAEQAPQNPCCSRIVTAKLVACSVAADDYVLWNMISGGSGIRADCFPAFQ